MLLFYLQLDWIGLINKLLFNYYPLPNILKKTGLQRGGSFSYPLISYEILNISASICILLHVMNLPINSIV